MITVTLLTLESSQRVHEHFVVERNIDVTQGERYSKRHRVSDQRRSDDREVPSVRMAGTLQRMG